mmetsp:Transcript_46580/g.87202  ORF Transcript_46580/g.87202 Transcript_46580/m.87202 type:complete len:154 (-) Transcript_46580:141-602(-)
MTICRRLSLPKDVLDLIEQGSSGPVKIWAEELSETQKRLLQFARAVITNPEVMCIHKPVMTYTDKYADKVLEMLREFCVHKGVEEDVETRHQRRPRTCVLTAAKVSSVRQADHVYLVSSKSGIRPVPREIINKYCRDGAAQLHFEESATTFEI